MKKTILFALMIFVTRMAGYCQEPNNVNDDVYYQGDDNQQYDQNNTGDYYNNGDQNSAPTYQTFYDQLSPYGNWINYPGYGYCWVPNGLGPDFSPYATNGHWVYSDMGWTWVSDFDWGWGPFHYGRWFDDPYYGWVWVPGYDWAPAWVIWGDYGGYYGWACIGPGVVLTPHYRPGFNYWHFVDHGHLGDHDFHNYMHRPAEVFHGNEQEFNRQVNIVGHANTYNQSVFFAGPKASEVEKYSGQKVERVKINNVASPTATKVNGNQLNVYRPNIVRTQAPHGAPTKVTAPENIQPVNKGAQPPVRNTTPVQPQQQRQNQQQWTPPRQNTPPQQNNPPQTPRQTQPEQRYTPPVQRQTQPEQRSAPPVQRNFIPTERYSPPPQQHYSAPPQQHFSAPSAPRGGGGGRH